MKRIINIFLCAGAIALTAISCQKSIDDERPVTPPEKGDGHIEIRIGAALGDYTPVGATKADLINTVRASWNGGETVYVFDGTQCLGSLKATIEGEEKGYAILSTDDDTHTVDKPADGTSVLTLVYSPALKEKPEITDGALTISLANQDGSETPFVTYATLDYDGSESIVIENTILPFKFATSVVQFNCMCDNLTTGKPFRAAVLSNVSTACKLTFSADKAPAVSGTKIGQIFKKGDDNIIVNDNGSVVFQIDIPILEASSYARNLIVNQYFDGDSKPHRNVNNAFPKSELPMGTSFNIACQMKNAEAPKGAINGVFTVNEDGKQVYFSGCNLYYYNKLWYCHGLAQWENKEANGDVGDNYKNKTGQMLFGWGDNTPLRTDTDDDKYNWPTDGSDPWGSKADNSADDYPKGTWRTLSIDEWNFLLSGCPIRNGKYKEGVQIRTSEYGGSVLGTGLVIAPDDFPEKIKSYYTETEWGNKYGREYGLVFLPLGGRRYGTTVGNVGSGSSGGGYYWSSTTKENYTSHAWVMSFSEATVWYWNDEPKHTGASVRLVSDVKY